MTETRITSRKNVRIQQVRRLLNSRRERESTGLFVADGTKLLEEAIRYYSGLQTVILSDGIDCKLPDHIEVIRVPTDVMDYISPMETPQGVLFLCKLPVAKDFVPKRGVLLLDGIQDPGNLGTILRTADALGVSVILLEGCADPYSHKTVRASMGAVFRTQPIMASWEQVQKEFTTAGIPIGVTALSPEAQDIRSADLSRMAVVIGSEGKGVRQEILNQADKALIIPMTPHCESLNAAVAATIVMWQMHNE